MLRIAVCDDSPQFLQTAADLVSAWAAQRNIPAEISTYQNGDELLEANSAKRFDIVFLDIIMPF